MGVPVVFLDPRSKGAQAYKAFAWEFQAKNPTRFTAPKPVQPEASVQPDVPAATDVTAAAEAPALIETPVPTEAPETAEQFAGDASEATAPAAGEATVDHEAVGDHNDPQ